VGAAAPWASIAHDSNLGPITVARVRSRFADYTPPPVPPLQPGGRAAAVLLPVFEEDGEARIVLTRRPETMPSHRGEIAFPGGKVEPTVDHDARDAALREAHEEIGLEPFEIEVLGSLPTYTTSTGYIVTPVVGLVQPGASLRPDPFEVAEVFEVPLSGLMNPANHQRHAVEVAGATRRFFSIPWQGVDANGAPRRYFIWGATAAMLRNLYRFLAA
jgi:8-oxo-dGTP pyrophosphatase MutT (NUDIX family)